MELDDVEPNRPDSVVNSIDVTAELVPISALTTTTTPDSATAAASTGDDEANYHILQTTENIHEGIHMTLKEEAHLTMTGDASVNKEEAYKSGYIADKADYMAGKADYIADKAVIDADETDDVFVKDEVDCRYTSLKSEHYISITDDKQYSSLADDSPGPSLDPPDDRQAGLQQAARDLDNLQREYEVKKTSNEERRRRLIFLMVFLLCMGGIVQGILVNGLINVVIGTLEKRYGLQSTDSGLIASCYDIASFICLLPVSYLGGRGTGSKPVWISGGIFLMGIGSLLFSLPHFLREGPRIISEGSSGVSFCRQPSAECTLDDQQYGDSNHLKYVFMIANLMHGAGAAPLYTLGVTYIDENVGAKDSAFYLGMFYTMAILGPALGYAMGGHFLNIHVDFLSIDMGSDPRGEEWTGAWWLGFVLCGFTLVLLAFFIFFLPPSIPGIEEPTDEQVCRSRLPSRGSSFRASFKARPLKQHDNDSDDTSDDEEDDIDLAGAGGGPMPVGEELVNALTLIFTNPTFVFLSLAGSAEGFLMQGLATFLPKLMQNQFSLSESKAPLYVGVVSVVAGAGGTLLGGAICKKFRLKVPGLLKFVSVTQFVAILTAIGLLVNCPVDRRLLGGGQRDIAEANQCARDCDCTASDYNPVCVEGEQYYNPCWAGCTGKNRSTGLYMNCTCAFSRPTIMQFSSPDKDGGVDGTITLTSSSMKNLDKPVSAAVMEELSPNGEPGLCKVSCFLLPIFIISFFFTMLITFMANMPVLTATLRCVDPSLRSFALGVQWLLIRGFGTIPGPVAFGRMLDSNCNQWKVGCSSSRNCLNYDNDRVSHIILQLTALCKGLTIIAFLVAMRLYNHSSSLPLPTTTRNSSSIIVVTEQHKLKTGSVSTELK